MKREYVKPMMESEAFVANEYVAACWTITCTNNPSCGSITPKTETDSYPAGVLIDGNNAIYQGTIGASNGCTTYTEYKEYQGDNILEFLAFLWDLIINGYIKSQTQFHPVSVESGHIIDNVEHPNASV